MGGGPCCNCILLQLLLLPSPAARAPNPSQVIILRALLQKPLQADLHPKSVSQAQPICDLPDPVDVGEHLLMADEVPVDEPDGGWKETMLSHQEPRAAQQSWREGQLGKARF